MTPITKNGSELIRVFDVHGNELEATYPKRAKGLVRKGRAQWLGSVNHDDPDFVPDSIILYDNADPMPRTADIQQTEVQSMFNNEIINNEYIPEINNTTGIPENAEEIDLAAQKMIEDLAAHITKTSEEIEKKRVEMAKEQEESNIAAAKARMEMEKQRVETEKRRREADEYAAVSFPDFGEIPEIPAEPVDYQSLLEGIIASLNNISLKELSGDPDIAAIETNYLHDQSENLREIYSQTIAAMEQIRREAAQAQAHSRRQQLLEEQIRRLEDDKNRQITIVSQLFRDEKITLDEMLEQTSHISSGYNDRILLVINQMK
ncbi:MAG: hypothetical protein IKI93_02105 [Clostridia bacterium]|nr:hypothetical protein [Clostridia bacterium]